MYVGTFMHTPNSILTLPLIQEQSQNSPPTWRPILIIVPTRLGVSKINPIYFPQLKAILRNKFSVGIAGGKPKQSLYFVAYQGDDVFYLDPHFVRTAVKPDDKWTEEVYQVRRLTTNRQYKLINQCRCLSHIICGYLKKCRFHKWTHQWPWDFCAEVWKNLRNFVICMNKC